MSTPECPPARRDPSRKVAATSREGVRGGRPLKEERRWRPTISAGKLLPFRRRSGVGTLLRVTTPLLADVAVGETSPLAGEALLSVRRSRSPDPRADRRVRRRAPRSGRARVVPASLSFGGEILGERRGLELDRRRRARGAPRRHRHAAAEARSPRGLPPSRRCRAQWRLAILLVDGEGVKIPDAATALRCTERTVWRWLDKAHRRLTEPRKDRDRRPPSRVRRFLRTGRLCPARWKLTRAVCNDLDPRMGWHLSGCSDCEREYVALLSLTARLSMLAHGGMTDAARARVAAILLAANRPSTRGCADRRVCLRPATTAGSSS